MDAERGGTFEVERIACPFRRNRASYARMWDWLENLPYLVIAAAVVIFFVLMMGVSLLEKQRVRELEAASRDSITPTSSYFDAMNAAAEAHRYLPCGTFIRTPKTKADISHSMSHLFH
jgi:hypothetical protein